MKLKIKLDIPKIVWYGTSNRSHSSKPESKPESFHTARYGRAVTAKLLLLSGFIFGGCSNGKTKAYKNCRWDAVQSMY